MCGKYSWLLPPARSALGSPPRVREILVRQTHTSHVAGITPACAGNTIQSYPLVYLNMGSPPRVREILIDYLELCVLSGITPACAGNTCNCGIVYGAPEDHPRVCGKYYHVNMCSICLLGSPPRVREIRNWNWTSTGEDGITPACAGNTSFTARLIIASEDHPRVCGKYRNKPLPYVEGHGSPPRVREIPSSVFPSAASLGITPACAGNTP